MKNGISQRKLGRNTSHRQALFRDMVTALVQHERIRTTLAKAKELRRHADKAITWAKKGGPQHHSLAHGFLRTGEATTKLFQVLGPRYMARDGGYTRVLRTGYRRGDRAEMAILEFVDRPGEIRLSRPARAPHEVKEKHVPLTERAAVALQRQKQVAAAGPSAAPSVAPAFPAPKPLVSQWAEFDEIRRQQLEYVQQRRAHRSAELSASAAAASTQSAAASSQPELR